jgi:formate/nitrite transporter
MTLARDEDRTPPPTSAVKPPVQFVTFEAMLPAAMALRAEDSGAKRVAMDPLNLLILSVLAGAFISFGAIFATVVTAGSMDTTSLPYGVSRLLAGLVFSVGLLMVVLAGAELFTGNNMIVMAWASGRVSTRALLENWGIAYVGNCFGALATAALTFLTAQYTFGGGAVGLNALNIAQGKTALPFLSAFALGIMCNALVCLAVWMCYGARTTIDRFVTILPPVAAFVACGFEHSIANVYFIPMALFIKTGAPDSFWTSIGRSPEGFPNLTWGNFLGNLMPVTLGNIIGGSVMVAAVYWFVYLRKPRLG